MSRAARDAGASPAAGSRIHEAQKYIISCIIPFVDLPASGVSPNYSTENDPNDNVGYGAVGDAGPCAIQASLLSLPARGGGFAASDYLGPELAAFARAEGPALEDEIVADLAAAASRSCHRVEPSEYVATLRRLADALMVEFTSEKAEHPLGLGVARLCPQQSALRSALAHSLHLLGAGGPLWETRGLHFVWHSFRHGGASRAFLADREMSEIIVRGRWAAESSARHYVQAGRQMLLALALPPSIAALAARVERAGLLVLLAPDLLARLRAVPVA